MKAVIIAGGIGKRLGPLTNKIPKPMLKIGGKTILQHQAGLLKRYGISEIIICAGFLSGIIEKFISSLNMGLNISCSIEPEPLGTAGCIKDLEKELKEDFLVLYGDIILDMNIEYLTDYHFSKRSGTTLVIHPNDHPYDSDLVEIDPDNRIINFLNKPHKKNLVYRNLVNAGIYVLSNKVFPYIKKNKRQDFASDIFPEMLKNKEPVFAYNTPEYIKDMGTKDRLASVRDDLRSGKVKRLNLSNKRPSIFLDRDGVINEEVDLIYDPRDFKLLPGTSHAIKNINKTEYLSVVITNQPAVAKGLASIEDIKTVHKKMETLLGRQGAKIDAIYFCPHHPEKGFPGENIKYKVDCSCRKPKTGMIEDAKKELNIDLEDSFLIGDMTTDIQAAKNAGITSIGVRSGFGLKDKKFDVLPEYWADDLNDAVNMISSLNKYNDISKNILSGITKTGCKKYFIAIGGVSRSGKTIFADNLRKSLTKNGFNPIIINMDDWIIPLEERKPAQNVMDRFQINKFEIDLKKLLDGKKIKRPKYIPLKRGNVKSFTNYSINKPDVIIICGGPGLNSSLVQKIAHLKIYIAITDEVYKNRFYNFYKWKGLNKKYMDLLYNKRLRDEVSIIKNEENNADLIIRGDLYDNQ